MADCEVEGTIASPLSIPLERAMSPTGERSDEGRNIRTRQNPFGPQERQTRIDRAKIQRVKTGGPRTLQRRNRHRKPQRRNHQRSLKAALIEEFEDLFCSYVVHKEMKKRKLRPTESLFEYFLAMREIASKAHFRLDDLTA
ncbi:hypothetical protein TNCV_3371771 [Trichonephila clavipes]|nr:hypothetical protein TNCV_3371771 [Trichonephila clavipes]